MLSYFTSRSVVVVSLYASLVLLSQVGELLACGGVMFSGESFLDSALHWPKSPQYDTPPKLISGNAPKYQMSQSSAGNSGFAIVAFTVRRDGRTSDVHVLQASYPYFGSHTVLGVRDWKFEPARKNGQPVVVHGTLYLPFNTH